MGEFGFYFFFLLKRPTKNVMLCKILVFFYVRKLNYDLTEFVKINLFWVNNMYWEQIVGQ